MKESASYMLEDVAGSRVVRIFVRYVSDLRDPNSDEPRHDEVYIRVVLDDRKSRRRKYHENGLRWRQSESTRWII